MNNLNSIILEGNLVKDPVMKITPNGHSVTTFTIATNRFYKQNDKMVGEVSYFDTESWGKLAETCADILKKGRGVRVVGRLMQDRWEDPVGTFHTRVKVIAEHVEFKPVYKKTDDKIAQEETADEASLSTEEAIAAI